MKISLTEATALALQNKLQEADVIVSDNLIDVDLETLLKEAIKYLQSETGAKISLNNVEPQTIKLTVDGSANSISVLKDRLNVNGEDGLVLNTGVANLKQKIAEILDTKWAGKYTVKLTDYSDYDPTYITMQLQIDLKTIPYPITIRCALGDDGYVSMRLSVYGDKSKQEVWDLPIRPENLVDKLSGIEDYFIKNSNNLLDDK